MNGYNWLLLAGVFEVGFVYFLKLNQQHPNLGWGFLVCAILSFECLSRSLKTVPLNLAYALWTGIGAVGAVLLETVWFGEPITPLRAVLLLVLIGALVGLKLNAPKPKHTAKV